MFMEWQFFKNKNIKYKDFKIKTQTIIDLMNIE